MNRPRFILAIVLVVLAALPSISHAQTTSESHQMPETQSDRARMAVREGVRGLRDYSAQSRFLDGWGNIIGGTLISGLGAWLVVDGVSDDDTPVVLLGSAFGLAGAMNIVSGIFTLSTASAIERTTSVILANERELATSGYLLLAHEAERARQARVLGGIVGLASSVGSGLLLIPLLTDSSDRGFVGLSDTIWIALIAGSATIGLVNATLSLFSKSVPEEIFEDVRSFIKRESVSLEVSPGVVRDTQQGLHPGIVLRTTF